MPSFDLFPFGQFSYAEKKQTLLNDLENPGYVQEFLQVIDGMGDKGFSPKDQNFGHSLAVQAKTKKKLTEKQLYYGRLLLKKHIDALIIHFTGGQTIPKPEVGGIVVGMDLASGPDKTVVTDSIAETACQCWICGSSSDIGICEACQKKAVGVQSYTFHHDFFTLYSFTFLHGQKVFAQIRCTLNGKTFVAVATSEKGPFINEKELTPGWAKAHNLALMYGSLYPSAKEDELKKMYGPAAKPDWENELKKMYGPASKPYWAPKTGKKVQLQTGVIEFGEEANPPPPPKPKAKGKVVSFAHQDPELAKLGF
jgi:hypothetical protein